MVLSRKEMCLVSSGPKPRGALRGVSVCSRTHGSLLVAFSQSCLTNGHMPRFILENMQKLRLPPRPVTQNLHINELPGGSGARLWLGNPVVEQRFSGSQPTGITFETCGCLDAHCLLPPNFHFNCLEDIMLTAPLARPCAVQLRTAHLATGPGE